MVRKRNKRSAKHGFPSTVIEVIISLPTNAFELGRELTSMNGVTDPADKRTVE